jgi:hypothetical protein
LLPDRQRWAAACFTLHAAREVGIDVWIDDRVLLSFHCPNEVPWPVRKQFSDEIGRFRDKIAELIRIGYSEK